ncbi:hypothetical protein [Mariluticola halotolerans]|uniref:hypothetical protein n=1 Tax=Mariluticola halotolerans TaxID=2909283 RepID=UPI0026E48591|nr:hypothetical protein [Mariluticola halotolerans]UJQ95011.1 hypothetical protein L1P08_03220 [Mariluticola halotolerans]
MTFRVVLAFVMLTFSFSAFAQTAPQTTGDKAVFAFGGRLINDNFENSFIPFIPPYEDNYVVGAGYQQFFYEPVENWKIGLEIGAAARFGEALTGEVWAGAVTRYDGLVIGDTMRISPALTFGLSAITQSMGVETLRETINNGNASLLFYLSPEISLGMTDTPNTEVFYRLHHRSGAWGFLGGLADGHNAHTIGLRQHF